MVYTSHHDYPVRQCPHTGRQKGYNCVCARVGILPRREQRTAVQSKAAFAFNWKFPQLTNPGLAFTQLSASVPSPRRYATAGTQPARGAPSPPEGTDEGISRPLAVPAGRPRPHARSAATRCPPGRNAEAAAAGGGMQRREAPPSRPPGTAGLEAEEPERRRRSSGGREEVSGADAGGGRDPAGRLRGPAVPTAAPPRAPLCPHFWAGSRGPGGDGLPGAGAGTEGRRGRACLPCPGMSGFGGGRGGGWGARGFGIAALVIGGAVSTAGRAPPCAPRCDALT